MVQLLLLFKTSYCTKRKRNNVSLTPCKAKKTILMKVKCLVRKKLALTRKIKPSKYKYQKTLFQCPHSRKRSGLFGDRNVGRIGVLYTPMERFMRNVFIAKMRNITTAVPIPFQISKSSRGRVRKNESRREKSLIRPIFHEEFSCDEHPKR
jgi:hypothetical protein